MRGAQLFVTFSCPHCWRINVCDDCGVLKIKGATAGLPSSAVLSVPPYPLYSPSATAGLPSSAIELGRIQHVSFTLTQH